MKTGMSPKQLYLQWHITEKCNWRCKHCYQESYETPEMTLGQIFGVLEQYMYLVKKWGIRKPGAFIAITGGEPLVSPYFFSLLARMHKFDRFINYTILSNGSLLNEEVIKKMKLLGITEFQISLEGMEDNNDSVRGEGSFDKIIKSFKLLIKHGIRPVISMSLHKKNSKDIESMVDLFDSISENKLGVNIGARRIVPWGNASEMKGFMQEPLELKDFYEKIEIINKKLKKSNSLVRVVVGCESGISNGCTSDQKLMNANHCAIADGRIITVMPNGDVYPCRRLPIKVGNVLENSLEEIYYSEAMQNLISRDGDHIFCKECESYQNCLRGAPCVTYAYAGKMNIPDVQCWRAYKNLQEVNDNKYSEKQ